MGTLGTAHKSIAGWAFVTILTCHSGAPSVRAQSAPPPDAFYAALHGEPQPVDAAVLVAAPGRFVGRPVRTTGRLMAVEGTPSSFELAIGKSRVLLRLEPEAKAIVAARSVDWAGRPVVLEGLFYREADVDGSGGLYALRAWLLRPVTEPPRRAEPPTVEGARVSLQDLVYGSGRYDGQLIRVRGSYRGSNRHADLPERTRKGRSDWVIKDGYFAAWVTGREARGANWDLTQRSSSASDAVVEITGVPATSGGVVRIQARDVGLSTDFVVGGALGQPRDAGLQAVSPRVSFAWPIPGDPLRRRGQMILQFSKPLDPPSLEGRLRVRYGAGATRAPAVSYEYRQRYRALVVLPEPPPPPGTEVVVELLEGIIDVDGRALAPALERDRGEPSLDEGVVDRVRFRSAP